MIGMNYLRVSPILSLEESADATIESWLNQWKDPAPSDWQNYEKSAASQLRISV